MKKLMIIACAIASISVVQASTFNWTTAGTSTGKKFYASDGVSALYTEANTPVVYLFCNDVMSQDKLLSAIRNGGAISSQNGIASSQTIGSASKISAQEFTYGTAGNSYKFYMAVIDTTGNLFLSSEVNVLAQSSDTPDVSWSNVKTMTQISYTDDVTATFAGNGAGWYAVGTEIIPEPTSGMLMLLGMMGLALRRKQRRA